MRTEARIEKVFNEVFNSPCCGCPLWEADTQACAEPEQCEYGGGEGDCAPVSLLISRSPLLRVESSSRNKAK